MDKFKIVCIGFPKWKGNYVKSTVMLMTRLAKYYDVLYADYQYTIKDLIIGILKPKNQVPVLRIIGLKSRVEVISAGTSNIFLYTSPPMIPINWISSKLMYDFMLRVNNFIFSFFLKRVLNQLNFENRIVINAFNPFYGVDNVNKLGELKTIYYCYDQIAAAQWANKHGSRLENDYLTKVDAVVTTSDTLYREKSKLNQNTFCVPNGVDYQLFSRFDQLSDQDELKIGYIGSIDYRLDYPLLEYLFQELPDLKFEFIGRIVDTSSVNNLKRFSNVDFKGPLPYELLPEWLSSYTICIIPFVKNEFTRSIYPMKINEYLAASKLVVITDFSDLPEFDNIVLKAHSKEEFLEHIKLIQRDKANFDRNILNGKKVAYNNSWENRALEFSKIIQKL